MEFEPVKTPGLAIITMEHELLSRISIDLVISTPESSKKFCLMFIVFIQS